MFNHNFKKTRASMNVDVLEKLVHSNVHSVVKNNIKDAECMIKKVKLGDEIKVDVRIVLQYDSDWLCDRVNPNNIFGVVEKMLSRKKNESLPQVKEKEGF